MADQGFPRAFRIRHSADYERVFAQRSSASDERLVVYVAPNALPHPRLGMVVSRKLGPAVARNRWRRLLREAFRLSRAELAAGLDLVVIPKLGVKPQLAELMRSLPRVAGRAAKKLDKAR